MSENTDILYKIVGEGGREVSENPYKFHVLVDRRDKELVADPVSEVGE